MPIAKKGTFFWYDFRYKGRRYRGSTKESTKAAARYVEAELLRKLEEGDLIPVRGKRAPLLRDFLPQFQASYDNNQLRAAKTKLYYRDGARLILSTPLAEYPLDRITTSVVSAVQFPHSAATGNCAIRTLRRVLAYAVELRILSEVPRMHLYREQGRDVLFTPEMEANLLQVATQPLADVFVLLMDTGLRPVEACRLRWEDVLWETGMLRVPDGKTSASRREIGMSARVLSMLKGRVRNSSSSWVFPSRKRDAEGRKGQYPITTINKAFGVARKLAGLPAGLVPYCTRHTFATDLIQSSGNLKLAMRTMGHVDVKTAARYQHPGTSQVAGLIDQRNKERSVAIRQNGHTFGHTGQVVN